MYIVLYDIVMLIQFCKNIMLSCQCLTVAMGNNGKMSCHSLRFWVYPLSIPILKHQFFIHYWCIWQSTGYFIPLVLESVSHFEVHHLSEIQMDHRQIHPSPHPCCFHCTSAIRCTWSNRWQNIRQLISTQDLRNQVHNNILIRLSSIFL